MASYVSETAGWRTAFLVVAATSAQQARLAAAAPALAAVLVSLNLNP